MSTTSESNGTHGCGSCAAASSPGTVDPACGGTFVSHGRDREWVYMLPWDPETQPVETLSVEHCAALVRAAMADPDVPFEVLTVGTWHMSAQVAERFRSGRTDDVQESTAAMHAILADPAGRAGVEAAIANQAIHFDLLGLQLGHRYDGPLVAEDGTPAVVLDEPARDYLPSTRPGGRLPHAWLPDGSSTLDLIDVRVPTVLVRDGTRLAEEVQPSVVVSCPAGAWDEAFGLGHDESLVVRPDQHIACRGPASGVAATVTPLFNTPATA